MSMDKKYENIYNYKNFISLLNEGLINTYPIKTAIKLILREISYLKIKAKVDSDEKTNTIFIKGYSETFLKKDIKNLIRLISTFGYFPSTFGFYNENEVLIDSINYSELNSDIDYTNFFTKLDKHIDNSFYTDIIIESKFNRKITDIPDKLYHITKANNSNKISKSGICPRSFNKRSYHPERIYLGYSILLTKGLANQFGKGEYILYEIDMNKKDINGLNLKGFIKIYDDPDFTGNGCYTYENIPPDSIKMILKVSIT